MEQQKKGEVAYALLKDFIAQKGLSYLKPNELRRDLTNAAKRTGVPVHEIFVVIKEIINSLLDEAASEKNTEDKVE